MESIKFDKEVYAKSFEELFMEDAITMSELFDMVKDAKSAADKKKALALEEAERQAAAQKKEKELRAKTIVKWATDLLEGNLSHTDMTLLIEDYLHTSAKMPLPEIDKIDVGDILTCLEKGSAIIESLSWLLS